MIQNLYKFLDQFYSLHEKLLDGFNVLTKSLLVNLQKQFNNNKSGDNENSSTEVDMNNDTNGVEHDSFPSLESNTEQDTEYTERYASLPRTIVKDCPVPPPRHYQNDAQKPLTTECLIRNEQNTSKDNNSKNIQPKLPDDNIQQKSIKLAKKATDQYENHSNQHEHHTNEHEDHSNKHEEQSKEHEDHSNEHEDHSNKHEDHSDKHEDHTNEHESKTSKHVINKRNALEANKRNGFEVNKQYGGEKSKIKQRPSYDSSTDSEESDLEAKAKFVGSYSKKEKEKWKHPVEMPNNPYSPENIERRLSNKSNTFGLAYGRDYYIREAKKSAGSRKTPTDEQVPFSYLSSPSNEEPVFEEAVAYEPGCDEINPVVNQPSVNEPMVNENMANEPTLNHQTNEKSNITENLANKEHEEVSTPPVPKVRKTFAKPSEIKSPDHPTSPEVIITSSPTIKTDFEPFKKLSPVEDLHIFKAIPALIKDDSSEFESSLESAIRPNTLDISSDSDLSIERTYNLETGKVVTRVGDLKKEIIRASKSPEGIKYLLVDTADGSVDENHNVPYVNNNENLNRKNKERIQKNTDNLSDKEKINIKERNLLSPREHQMRKFLLGETTNDKKEYEEQERCILLSNETYNSDGVLVGGHTSLGSFKVEEPLRSLDSSMEAEQEISDLQEKKLVKNILGKFQNLPLKEEQKVLDSEFEKATAGGDSSNIFNEDHKVEEVIEDEEPIKEEIINVKQIEEVKSENVNKDVKHEEIHEDVKHEETHDVKHEEPHEDVYKLDNVELILPKVKNLKKLFDAKDPSLTKKNKIEQHKLAVHSLTARSLPKQFRQELKSQEIDEVFVIDQPLENDCIIEECAEVKEEEIILKNLEDQEIAPQKPRQKSLSVEEEESMFSTAKSKIAFFEKLRSK